MEETITIHVRDPDGRAHTLTGHVGVTLMATIREANLPILADCGGGCACATCHVYVLDDFGDRLPEPEEDEEDMLDFAVDCSSASRLSCQIELTKDMDGLKVEMAPGSY
ncbi:MAG: 2Fe-2S iron-sulfur cluster-binding protein [Pseudomonadota bacterium]